MLRIFRKQDHEKNYYEKLFTKSGQWSTAWPNNEELLRWIIIRDFIEQNAITDLKNHIRDNFSILDVGCGRGWISNLCSPYGVVKAIEPVKKVAAYGKKLYPFLDIGTDRPDELIKKGHQYDLIICSEVIEHIPDNEKQMFANQLKQLLKPGGHLIITTPRSEALSDWTKYIHPDQPVEDWLSEAQVERLFNDLAQISKKNLAIKPAGNAPEIPIYQVHLFRHE